MFQFGTKFFNHYFRTPLGAQNTAILKNAGKGPQKKKIFLVCFFLNISTFTVPDQMPANHSFEFTSFCKLHITCLLPNSRLTISINYYGFGKLRFSQVHLSGR